ncbi:hypothetical protein Pmani_013961 [Petrolisthes manimaculis]|uniref:Uncharacterized protein n=1 Tax=Petrolisthes manimaculis TaxID=1843537 RepID=A0AAE1PTS5_9EUCA|nr:hypothetical protein Pmani_013961 [Petrolisthes manimaculis]
MEHLDGRTAGKKDPILWQTDDCDGGGGGDGVGIGGVGEVGGGGVSNVDKLRGYYDEARIRLKNYLGREDGEFCG